MEDQKEPMTIEQCVEYIVNMLKENKIKEKDIEVYDDTINFTYKDVEYQVYVEGPEDIHYSVVQMKGVGLESDFWMNKDEYGDHLYIEDYLFNVVLDNRFGYIKKIWSSLEKLDENDGEGDLTSIVACYFGLTE